MRVMRRRGVDRHHGGGGAPPPPGASRRFCAPCSCGRVVLVSPTRAVVVHGTSTVPARFRSRAVVAWSAGQGLGEIRGAAADFWAGGARRNGTNPRGARVLAPTTDLSLSAGEGRPPEDRKRTRHLLLRCLDADTSSDIYSAMSCHICVMNDGLSF